METARAAIDKLSCERGGFTVQVHDGVDRAGTARSEVGSDLEPTRAEIGASPIFTHVWPDSEELNAELRRIVLRRMATSPGLKKSNCGGWQSERNLQLWPDPAIEVLLERVRAMLRTVVSRTVTDPDDALLDGWDIEAWANVNQLGDTVAAHTHSGGVNMWAGIYYVDCGSSPDAVNSGFTRFMDMSGTPRPVSGCASGPRGSAISRSANCAEPERTGDYDMRLEPTPGKMVIFPATLPHYVTAYHGTDKRITIAFNLRHTKFVVADFENPYSRRRELWRDYRGFMLFMFQAKRMIREVLANLVPVERWPHALRRKLLGGGD